MNESFETSAQIEAFTKRIEALSRQHQEMALAICAVRMARDVGLLPNRKRARPHRMWVWMQRRATTLFDRNPKHHIRAHRSAKIVVIDGSAIPERPGGDTWLDMD